MADSPLRLDNLLSALIGGVAGGLLVWWLAPSPAGMSPAPDESVIPGATADTSQPAAQALPEPAEERIERLEKNLRSVQQRVADQAQVDVYEDEGEDGAGKRVTLNASDPKFQSAVRAVLDKAKWEEEQIEQDRREEERDRRISGQVNELIEALELTDEQADQVEIVLQAQSETFRSLRESENRPATPQAWRDKFTEIQAETRKKLAEFLSEDQLTAYDKHVEEQFGPWGGRRGSR